ncbi:ABC transporter ATP-binding protein [Lentilactobacillus senioris]|uniref:ATP-binding cassette domain-containing protein n=1 Tax=Lentilactobacillus senioris TaxID=931534 RepID=UPI0022800BE9|nr:ABC transporter ATP-binding protein [Lentilactobacillus senioris]MCY9806245.1 ABC transporter ATP-binding protein [Lentilactobacillus senioris]
MLVIQNLTLSTRQVILQNFSYQFQKGNSYLISATNGSGKTTFFRSLVNLKAVDQGTVTFDQNKYQFEAASESFLR